ncbi:MAG: efflux transporter outer membrane subunit [Achromobacter sp.]|jgi:multidrug efflux system outer membrane protein|uniref:Toluene efflux pump outer membrane protein TtgI n=1 Tax=Achromobacter insuavis TaxID=1287735 RepID=A0A6J5BGR8_9BURK|nr:MULTISPECIES: efflux transporter outer membrane subunit [Achromobacter]MBN9638872.1 efflux transporter outer membrane subunit [Achromobacter sp.]CAB3706031.1 Toluene efflux pump outer membrane protein TtgI [Achromobacter insuavis]CUI83885.1 Probable efflux pump outer membrane protein ttgC precursor [Achromobacter sp. 2789STDY5608621]CUJ15750.1 Probable efflux pump outer membrane protein ttgC precursor [Achromobacter sp. 2789STDY5608633]CUJ56716.1 Probable efflux pump outer membrane protein 
MNTRFFLPLMLSAALAGCAAVGPDYQVPAGSAATRPSAQAPFAEAREGVFQRDQVPGHWWRLYNDPVLDGLVEKALAANTDLRVASANLERAQAAVRETQAQQQPSLGVNASPTFGHVSGIQELAPGIDPPNRWSYSAGASMSYQLDLFGQIRRAVEAAGADAQSAQAAYDATRVTVAAETTRAYANLCSAGMQLASAEHSVKVQQESLDAVSRLQRAGRGTALDVTRARSQLEQLRANLPPFQAQQRTALYRLAALTGQTPAEIPTTLLQCAAAPQLSQTIPVGDGAALLRRRPDIRQAERTLAAATARIGVATADLYPKITLGLSGASGGPAAMFGDRGTFSWSVGPLISWTLPNTGAVQARIAEAEANTKAAVARFDASVLNALRETESALVVYARQLDRQAALQAARDQAAQAASQARQLFQYGKTDYLTVLDAERTLASSESALAAGQAELSNDQIAVFLALGGGWEK